MDIEKLQKVIGTPEENRDILVKALLLDLKMKCSDCGKKFLTDENMKDLMIVAYTEVTNPNKLQCHLECIVCAHQGIYTFKPNPLIKSY